MIISDIRDKRLLTSLNIHNLEDDDIKKFKTVKEIKEYIKKLGKDKTKIKYIIIKMLSNKEIITKRMIKEEIKKKRLEIKNYTLKLLIEECIEKIYYDIVFLLVEKFGYERITRKHIKLYFKTHKYRYDKYYIFKAIEKIFIK